MFRNYDWRRIKCLNVREALVEFPQGDKPPINERFACVQCNTSTMHARQMSLPAKYLYDRPVRVNVHGGRFDTTGNRRPPPLPVPEGIYKEPGHEWTKSDSKEAFDKLVENSRSPAYKEAKRERAKVVNENKAKRARFNAMKRDKNIDLRSNRLAGDPNIKS